MGYWWAMESPNTDRPCHGSCATVKGGPMDADRHNARAAGPQLLDDLGSRLSSDCGRSLAAGTPSVCGAGTADRPWGR